jgi:DNA-binding NarL/FixJ family response regulator
MRHHERVVVDVQNPRVWVDKLGDLVRVVGRGQAGPKVEIAQRLFINEGTVKTHINHVFTKLDLRDRAAAIVFAYDDGLVRLGQ